MSNRQIAKNTVFLYVRMGIVLVVSLFTTRIVLSNLGIEDYGIYNVVGSIVSLFSFLQIAITSANYRYFAFAIGKKDEELLSTTFKCAAFLCLCIAVFVILIGESLGLYYIYNYLNVPSERFEASLYTFHLSVVSCAVSCLYAPFYSDVISHERMDFFAYLSIVDVLFKVLIAVSLAYSPIDRLVFYAFLLLLMQISILIAYFLFCYYKFDEVKLLKKVSIDRKMLKGMSSFSGWTLFVAIADLFVSQGLNMIINLFYSPIVNAARGIAVQLQGAVDNFRVNLQTALNPQITKRYATKNYDGMLYLMSCSARFSTYVMLLISFPFFFVGDEILTVWLEEVPIYTVSFIYFVLSVCIIDGISNPYVVAVSATGSVKKFQSLVGMVKFLTLPLCYFAALLCSSPVGMFFAYFIGTILVVFVRILLCSKIVGISMRFTIHEVFIPICCVSISGFLINYILISCISVETTLSILLYIIFCMIIFSLCCYIVGLKHSERCYIKMQIRYRWFESRNNYGNKGHD